MGLSADIWAHADGAVIIRSIICKAMQHLGLPEAKGPILPSGDIALFEMTLSWQVYNAGDHMTVSMLACWILWLCGAAI